MHFEDVCKLLSRYVSAVIGVDTFEQCPQMRSLNKKIFYLFGILIEKTCKFLLIHDSFRSHTELRCENRTAFGNFRFYIAKKAP